MKKKNKIKFLEEQYKYFDSDCPTKSILAKRVDEIGLGYEQVKVEPEVLLPDTNYLGVPDKFAAYKNETDGSEYIASPSLSANKEEVSAFYLGGTFVANTCETMLTVDPREVLEEPESVEETVAELNLSIMVEDLSESCIIPLEEVDGWGDTNVEDWDKPVDENGEEIVGEWVVMNGGVVYDGKKKTTSLVIKFIPKNREEYKEITIDLEPSIKQESSLFKGLIDFWDFNDGILVGRKGNSVVLDSGKIASNCVVDDGLSGNNNIRTTAKIPSEPESTSVSWSVSFWVRKVIDGNYWTGIGDPHQSGVAYVNIQPGTNKIICNSLTSTNVIPTDGSSWVHVVITQEENKKETLYWNGQKDIDTDATQLKFRMARIWGSKNYEGSFGLLNGYTDEIGLWDRCLTDKEIKLLYNNGEGFSYDDW